MLPCCALQLDRDDDRESEEYVADDAAFEESGFAIEDAGEYGDFAGDDDEDDEDF